MKTVILFSRYPAAGRTKTRLIPAIGADKAALIQTRMTRHILNVTRELQKQNPEVRLEVHYDGSTLEQMEELFGAGDYIPQNEGHLGLRMEKAAEWALNRGAKSVILIGSDCPDITPVLLGNAFSALTSCDAVIGPAADGGYYLIGLKKIHPDIFSETIPWGSDQVLKESEARLGMNGISYSLLPELCDVDYPKDLVLLKNRGLADDILFPEISVIIPALNEEKSIAETIEAASGDSIQIIVADGGSSDNTARIASDSHALVVQSGRGRGIQQNEGAKYAMGEILLFLHADTLLPKGYSGEIKSALLSANYRAGAFLFSVDSARWIFKLVSFLTNLRSTLLHFPYGDQALFFHRDLFFLTGGFPKIPVMEDYVLVKKIRRSVPVYISRLKVVTSARRWQKLGVARTFIINQLMILGYHLGIPAEKLDRFYRTRKQ